MKLSTWPLSLGALGILSAVGFATDRFLAYREVSKLLEAKEAECLRALSVYQAHREAFGSRSGPTGPSALKTLTQEAAAKEGLLLASLSESERDLGKGRREKSIAFRLQNALHAPMIRFLSELESSGGGGRLKELHLHPSRSAEGGYEEVEGVFAKAFSAGGLPR